VSGGAGVTLNVHEGRSLIESGVDGYVGAGLVHQLSARTGLHVDARLHLLSGGIAESADLSTRGTVTAGLFVTF
jgi:hypothetical protein